MPQGFEFSDKLLAIVAAAQGLFTMATPLFCAAEDRIASLVAILAGFAQLALLLAQIIWGFGWIWVASVFAALATAAAAVQACGGWVRVELWAAAGLAAALAVWLWWRRGKASGKNLKSLDSL